MGFRLHFGFRLGVVSWLNWLWCLMRNWLKPLVIMVRLLVSLWVLRRFFSWVVINRDNVVLGKISFLPKWAYLRWLIVIFYLVEDWTLCSRLAFGVSDSLSHFNLSSRCSLVEFSMCYLQLMMALVMTRKGHPRVTGVCNLGFDTGWVSRTMKSTEYLKSPTRKRTLAIFPLGTLTE